MSVCIFVLHTCIAWIFTLKFPERKGPPCLEQVLHLKFKWMQRDLSTQPFAFKWLFVRILLLRSLGFLNFNKLSTKEYSSKFCCLRKDWNYIYQSNFMNHFQCEVKNNTSYRVNLTYLYMLRKYWCRNCRDGNICYVTILQK